MTLGFKKKKQKQKKKTKDTSFLLGIFVIFMKPNCPLNKTLYSIFMFIKHCGFVTMHKTALYKLQGYILKYRLKWSYMALTTNFVLFP